MLFSLREKIVREMDGEAFNVNFAANEENFAGCVQKVIFTCIIKEQRCHTEDLHRPDYPGKRTVLN